MFILKNRLIFSGEHIGYRLQYKNTLYDISKGDLDLISEDFSISISQNNNGITDLQLVERGNLLIPLNVCSAEELTYSKYASLNELKRLEKTDTDLKKLYNEYNKKCFDNQLPKLVGVEWSSRMTSSAGICQRTRNKKTREITFKIKLSTHYHEKYPEEIIDTLVHEMIHVYHPGEGHGALFLDTMNRLNNEFGFKLAVYAHDRATERKINYLYACKNCGYEYKRVKRINTDTNFCGVKGCRGNLYLKDNYKGDVW